MQSQGVTRYMKCLDMLEAKYDKRIPREEYEKRRTSYEAFDAQAKELNRRYMSSLGTVDNNEGENLDNEDDEDDEDDDDEYDNEDGFIVDEDEDEDEDENATANTNTNTNAKHQSEPKSSASSSSTKR
jgi:hypothetical protein